MTAAIRCTENRRCARQAIGQEGRVHCAASAIGWTFFPRATSRKTSSSVERPCFSDELFRRRAIDDLAVLHHDHVVAEPLDLRHVVRGEKNGRAPLAPIVLDATADPVAGVGVERGSRLIEKEHLRVVDQRFRQGDARLLPSRDFSGPAVKQVAEFEIVRKLVNAAFDTRHAVEQPEDAEVLADGQPMRQLQVRTLELIR